MAANIRVISMGGFYGWSAACPSMARSLPPEAFRALGPQPVRASSCQAAQPPQTQGSRAAELHVPRWGIAGMQGCRAASCEAHQGAAPCSLSMPARTSEFSTLVVPTRMGRPFLWNLAISCTTAFHLPARMQLPRQRLAGSRWACTGGARPPGHGFCILLVGTGASNLASLFCQGQQRRIESQVSGQHSTAEREQSVRQLVGPGTPAPTPSRAALFASILTASFL